MKWQHTKEELEQLYSGIKQLRKPFLKLAGDGEHIAIIRPDGSLYMILAFLNDSWNSMQFDFFETTEAFMQFIIHMELAMEFNMVNIDTMMLRECLEVKWLQRYEMPDPQVDLIKDSGVSFARYSSLPLIVEFVPFTLTEFPRPEKQKRLLEFVQFVSNPDYLPIILKALRKKRPDHDVEGIPALVWDEEASTLQPTKQLVELPPPQTNPVIKKMYPEDYADIFVPEFTLYRYGKQIQPPTTLFYEMMLHASPEVVYDEEQQRFFHKYILLIGSTEEGLLHLEEFDALKVELLQESVLEFLAKHQESPRAFITTGAFGIYTVSALTNLLNKFGIDIGYKDQLVILDNLTSLDLMAFYEDGQIDKEHLELLQFYLVRPDYDFDDWDLDEEDD